MRLISDIHHRRSIRLPGYDYAQPGAYFVTICTQDRAILLGDVVGGAMRLNAAGLMVEEWWLKLPEKWPAIRTDVFVVMPNHFHAVVVNVGADPRVCPGLAGSNQDSGASLAATGSSVAAHAQGAHVGAPLHRIMQWFKTMTTNEYIRGVKEHDWESFPGKLWQRNYYEHVVRTDAELDQVRQYILDNPAKWDDDRENPRNW